MDTKLMDSKRYVIGVVKTPAQAEVVVRKLISASFAHNDISVLFPGKEATERFAHEKHTKAPEGAVVGVSAGGVLGGTLGALVGIGALAIPGLGPLLAAGPILAALSGAAVGATVGGLTGALVGLGLPEDQAQRYEKHLKAGSVVLAVHSEKSSDRKRARDIFEFEGAEDISSVDDKQPPAARPSSPPPRASAPVIGTRI
jgi:uncharacterized membrane protein